MSPGYQELSLITKLGNALKINSTKINDLDHYSLLTILEMLNVKDVSACSLVCLRWYRLTRTIIENKQKCLIVYYGLDPYSTDRRAHSEPIANQPNVTRFDPILIHSNRLLSESSRRLLEPVEMLIFKSNGHFKLDRSFTLSLLPNLKHLEIFDLNFCDFIQSASDAPVYICRSVDYLFVSRGDLASVSILFPNLVHFKSFDVGLRSFANYAQLTACRLKCLVLPRDVITNSFIDFLYIKCLGLQRLDIQMDEPLDIRLFARIIVLLAWIKKLNLFINKPTNRIKQVLIALKALLPLVLDYSNVTINHVAVQPDLEDLEPIYPLIDCADYLTQINQDQRANFNRARFYEDVSYEFKIFTNEDVDWYLDSFQNKFDHFLVFTIHHHASLNVAFDFDRMFKHLTKRLAVLEWTIFHQIPQAVLDCIPKHFPNLLCIRLALPSKKSYDLRFLYKLPYLTSLSLVDVQFKPQQLIDAFDHNRFLSRLVVKYKSKSADAYNKYRSKLESKISRMMETRSSIFKIEI